MGWFKGFSIGFIAPMLFVDFLVLLLISHFESRLYLIIVIICSICGLIGAVIASGSEVREIKNTTPSKRRPKSSSMPFLPHLAQKPTLQTAPSPTPVHTAKGTAQKSDIVTITCSICQYEFVMTEELPFCPRCGADV
jgi:hypothetical protein